MISQTELKQVVYVFKCNKSTLQVKGKINTITLGENLHRLQPEESHFRLSRCVGVVGGGGWAPLACARILSVSARVFSVT